MRDSNVKLLSSFHSTVFRLTAGRLGSRLVRNDMLLLTTIGAVSRNRHTVPLLYIRDGDGLVVVASYGGRPDHPDWFTNLVDTPDVTVQVGSDTWNARAEVVSDADHSRLWPQVVSAYAGYATYQERTSRIIPLVRLSVPRSVWKVSRASD